MKSQAADGPGTDRWGIPQPLQADVDGLENRGRAPERGPPLRRDDDVSSPLPQG